MNKLSLKIIGTGGAFDTELTNSSFIVSTPISKWLIDCGYNVFSKLKELEIEDNNIIKDLNYIFITHMDDDHIGGLKSLMYYRYFIYGKTTEIFVGSDVYNDMCDYINVKEFNKSANGKDDSGKIKFKYANIVNINKLNFIADAIDAETNLIISTTKCIHHLPSNGILFMIPNNEAIWISGDTTASKELMLEITERIQDNEIKKVLFLHDYSFWDNPDENVHACETNIKQEYTIDFISKLRYYHNNSSSLMGTYMPDVNI